MGAVVRSDAALVGVAREDSLAVVLAGVVALPVAVSQVVTVEVVVREELAEAAKKWGHIPFFIKFKLLSPNQKYLKFPLTPSLSPMGRGEG
jgi:hypothetical protein